MEAKATVIRGGGLLSPVPQDAATHTVAGERGGRRLPEKRHHYFMRVQQIITIITIITIMLVLSSIQL
jgi:hypothetical protein